MVARSLSRTEARVVLALEEAAAEDVSLDLIERYAQVRRGFARKIAHGLVAKGWLQRVGRGRYLLNPSANGPEATPETDPLRLGSRLVDPYYFGFATAAELWGLLLRPGRTYYLASPRRSTSRELGVSRFQVVHVAPRRFFGTTVVVRRGQRVVVSDLERTLLDCLDRPGLSGGLAGVAQVIARAKPRIRWHRLGGHLRRFGNRRLGARLGFLVERLRPSIPVPRTWAEGLRQRLPETWTPLGSTLLYGERGERDARWRVVSNVPRAELLAETDAEAP